MEGELAGLVDEMEVESDFSGSSLVGGLEVSSELSGSSLTGGVVGDSAPWERTDAEFLPQHILRRVLLNLPIFSVFAVVVVAGVVFDRMV